MPQTATITWQLKAGFKNMDPTRSMVLTDEGWFRV
jgi:hypothetical protein